MLTRCGSGGVHHRWRGEGNEEVDWEGFLRWLVGNGERVDNSDNASVVYPIHHHHSPPVRSTTTTISDNLSTTAPQTLKSRLQNVDTLYDIFLLSFSPTLVEIVGLSGYDFVIIDMEHGHNGISEAIPCLHALATARTPTSQQ
ncbi:hypothetical protein L6452_37787 [Arctium lappa]|uniref:Uncharacterized protein n=1 Tax=Arctium lappa TaxID=4217 RepID=A0ACB8Y4N2_ARCLA|nr:hypothetical protein L6452_37787 [Arctium lappa]